MLLETMEYLGLSSMHLLDWLEWGKESYEDDKLLGIIHSLECGEAMASGWILVRGQLRYKGRMVISRESKFKVTIL